MIERIVLWLVFCVLAVNLLLSVLGHIVCIKVYGLDWMRDCLFDILALAAMVIAEIFIFGAIY